MPPEKRVVVFKIKNVNYTCELPPDREVDVEKVAELVRQVVEEAQASGPPRMVMEYLKAVVVRLAVELAILEQALEGVREDGKD